MSGSSVNERESQCSECANGPCARHPAPQAAEPESVDALLMLARELSEKLQRRVQSDHRNEWRVARALSLSLLDALESTKGS